MHRAWDASKYDATLSMSIFKVKVIQGHEVKRKGQIKNFMFGTRDTCFYVSFSSRTRKMTLIYFMNGPTRTKFQNRKKWGNSVKQREKWPFLTFKIP